MTSERPAKRRDEEAAGSMEEDRISQLPEPILDHVITFLPQTDAVRTCLLSKSWRHLGPTRPKIEFRERDFRVSTEKFLSVVEKTLQRYVDQKLPIQEFVLSIYWPDSPKKPCSLLNKWIVKLQVLKRLSLHYVWIEEETFEKIMSSCQHLVLSACLGLSTFQLNKARNLKHFDCKNINSIEIYDAPYLETMSIRRCRNWYHLNKNYFFHSLKSLYLKDVNLPTELLNNLSSSNCPCLEELELRRCSNFSEFKLSNRSIKRLIIFSPGCPIKASIDAANMFYFEYRSSYFPSISFATTSREWKSRIEVWHYSNSNNGVLSTWSLKLHEFLKALGQSQISLYTFPLTNQDTCDGNSCDPIVVEHLYLTVCYTACEVPAVLNCLFRVCHPTYIGLPFYEKSQKILGIQLVESLWKTLANKGETTQCDFWQQDLVESSIQVLEANTNEWRPGQVCELSNNEKIRFRLKWRDIS